MYVCYAPGSALCRRVAWAAHLLTSLPSCVRWETRSCAGTVEVATLPGHFLSPVAILGVFREPLNSRSSCTWERKVRFGPWDC